MPKHRYSEVAQHETQMGQDKNDRSDLDRLTDGQEGREIIIVATWLRKTTLIDISCTVKIEKSR